MKKILFIVSLLALSLGIWAGYAQMDAQDGDAQIMLINMDYNQDEDADVMPISMDYDADDDFREPGYFGFYIETLTAEKAAKLGYKPGNGLIISDVIGNSPAKGAGLKKDDIIMEINDIPISSMDDFNRAADGLCAGDQVSMLIWRDKKKAIFTFDLGSRNQDTDDDDERTQTLNYLFPPKKTGYGGGGYAFTWAHIDMKDINELLANLSFPELREQGLLTSSWMGKGNIGKGLFLGGQVMGYDTKNSRKDGDYTLNMNYSVSMAGVTLDRRFALCNSLIASLGLMVGGGSHELTIDRNKGEYIWPPDAAALADSSFSTTFTRNYLIVQPRAELLYRMLSWFGLRLEAGYVYGYTPSKGWKVVDAAGYDVEVQGSPGTKLQGFTIGIGPWFGF